MFAAIGRWFASLNAWETVARNGRFDLQENAVTGRRRVQVAFLGGHVPGMSLPALMRMWVKDGQIPEARQTTVPSGKSFVPPRDRYRDLEPGVFPE